MRNDNKRFFTCRYIIYKRSFSNIALIGAWRGGVGAGTCIENGVKAADRLVDGLK